jgi:hypothetical protein
LSSSALYLRRWLTAFPLVLDNGRTIKLYPLRKMSDLGDRSLVQRLLRVSEGITGPVTRLLSLAAVAAIKSAAERIDEAAIEHVASRLEKGAS